MTREVEITHVSSVVETPGAPSVHPRRCTRASPAAWAGYRRCSVTIIIIIITTVAHNRSECLVVSAKL